MLPNKSSRIVYMNQYFNFKFMIEYESEPKIK